MRNYVVPPTAFIKITLFLNYSSQIMSNNNLNSQLYTLTNQIAQPIKKLISAVYTSVHLKRAKMYNTAISL